MKVLWIEMLYRIISQWIAIDMDNHVQCEMFKVHSIFRQTHVLIWVFVKLFGTLVNTQIVGECMFIGSTSFLLNRSGSIPIHQQ